MKIQLEFTTGETIEFLRKNSCVVNLEKIVMFYNVYHNDVERDEMEVYTVYKNGQPYCKPTTSTFEKLDWLNAAFHTVLKEKVIAL